MIHAVLNHASLQDTQNILLIAKKNLIHKANNDTLIQIFPASLGILFNKTQDIKTLFDFKCLQLDIHLKSAFVSKLTRIFFYSDLSQS
jgi:hypothetical protein